MAVSACNDMYMEMYMEIKRGKLDVRWENVILAMGFIHLYLLNSQFSCCPSHPKRMSRS